MVELPTKITERLATAIRTGTVPFGTDGRGFWIGLVIVGLSLVSGLATYLILTGLTSIVPTGEVVFLVLLVNAILVVATILVILWQVWGLWQSWKRKAAGSRLHVRVVALFTVIAVFPAILLAVFATISFSRTLDTYFSARTRAIVQNSLDVATAYVHEHGRVIRNDALNMARDIDGAPPEVRDDPKNLKAMLVGGSLLRELVFSYLIDGQGRILTVGVENPRIAYAPPAQQDMRQAAKGQVALLVPGSIPRVAAITKLESRPDTFLYIARVVDRKVIRHLQRTQAGVAEYHALDRRRAGVKFAYGLIYVAIALTLMLAAIWIGFWFAGRLVDPVRRLIGAAQQVSEGDLDVRVPVKRGEGDLRQLSVTFNHMTGQIKSQRDDLVRTNAQLTERRRFIEAVLSGVSAGVIGLDTSGRITLVNRSAETLLNLQGETLVGQTLEEALPDFARALGPAEEQGRRTPGLAEINSYVGDTERTFAVRMTREQVGDEDHGSVMTFDDVTDLVAAQRTAAWADVARRIAHEIKNPLTPIQLSAERLKRKYSRVVIEDREIFDKCTDTIIRQVSDVSRMVDEFSSFARMPKPEMKTEDLREVVREPVFLFVMSHPEIKFDTTMPETPVHVSCDRRLISQAITNLIKNACEAVQAVAESRTAPEGYKGHIETRITIDGEQAMIEIIDNGCGLPRQNRGRLLEPYVTTRAKGTGLGLAIVNKVIEQHGGTLGLDDANRDGTAGGALMRIRLPLVEPEGTAGTNEDGTRRAAADPAKALMRQAGE
ncbi:MAG: PAS domain-containing sensor histidine kinase [Hyphomicrobiaceae bacterium]